MYTDIELEKRENSSFNNKMYVIVAYARYRN